ncbi:MAG: 1,4-dihydroxy-2-naphthoyl-CoA synthase [Turneriella sp.]|nr:1,4-dihydroxy-2-naphthoyl-CoA synthase [Turneriella sp.]
MGLECTITNRVAKLKINHNIANTLTHDTFEAFASQLEKLENDSAVSVIFVVGNDSGYFSNGFEPSLFLKKSYDENLETCKLINKTAMQYFFLQKPIIACLNGHAMGAGAVFALFADWRFMSEANARLGFPEALLGMNFPAFVAYYMKDLIGVQKTRDILFAGKSLKGTEALQIGLVDKLFDETMLLEETQKFAEKLARSPLQVLVGMKRARIEPYRTLFEALQSGDAATLAHYVTSPVTQEGLLSIVEKRRPRFDSVDTKPFLQILKGGAHG